MTVYVFCVMDRLPSSRDRVVDQHCVLLVAQGTVQHVPDDRVLLSQ